MISIAAGMAPPAITADTASPAVSMVGNAAISVITCSGTGSSLTRILVIAQSVPSEPTSTPSRSSPGRSGPWPPTQARSPSGNTTSMPRTWLVVTP